MDSEKGNIYLCSSLTSGQVYCNAKTKIFPDGTTNMTVFKVPIFKDSDIKSTKQIKDQYYDDCDADYRSDQLTRIFKDNGLSFTIDFPKLKEREKDGDLSFLEKLGITIEEWKRLTKPYETKHRKKKTGLSEPRHDSMKRAKDQIFDYILCNDFEYFFTGTINPDTLDSTDTKALLKPVQTWLKEMVRRNGLSYVMVAERHKKGGIHFHGLFKADNLALVESGTKLYKGYKKPVSEERAKRLGLTDGRTVYNLKQWKFGFTTAIKLTGDRMNTAFYVTKYITKDTGKIFGRFYWHSRNLIKPRITLTNVDFESIPGAEFNGFKYVFKRGGEQGATERESENVDILDKQNGETGNRGEKFTEPCSNESYSGELPEVVHIFSTSCRLPGNVPGGSHGFEIISESEKGGDIFGAEEKQEDSVECKRQRKNIPLP